MKRHSQAGRQLDQTAFTDAPDTLQAESPKDGERGHTSFAHHRLTSFGFGEALVKAEDDLVYKVLDVAGLWTSDKHHPVMREAF